MLPVLDVIIRPSMGKNPSKRDRKSGWIPAVIYDSKNNHIHLHEEQITWLLKKYGDNMLVDLKIGDQKRSALIKEVQRHPISGQLLHVDFKPVNTTEDVFVKVPINLINTEGISKQGGIIQTQKNDLEVKCEAKDMPRSINIDASKHNIGTTLKVKDVEVSEAISIMDNPDEIIAVISFAFRGDA